AARVYLPQKSLTLTKANQVITYVSRNLEPYRGFHIFMRALPEIQRQLPHAHVLIVGGDDISYGRPSDTLTYREKYLAEVGAQIELTRVHFLGRLPYTDYLRVLQIATAHVYLTYPFVLSWSMLEAMATGAIVIGSRTAPVEEVIENGRTGFLVEFFAQAELVDSIVHVFERPEEMEAVRHASIERVRTGFSLRDECLPRTLDALGISPAITVG
ncbi:glycosyltransferase, partial [Paraburkholderia xenovorans]|uniref:glycosyltransferase n=1 Tax=Paraburkholderia xenovorans TaxID=36873 RepID=UPI0038BB2D61